MKYTTTLLSLAAILCSLLTATQPARAQSTAFTYQGFLTINGQLVRTPHDIVITPFNAVTNGSAVAAPVTNLSVAVANGLFNVTLDFGGIFDGTPRWLDIAVRPTGSGAFTNLVPRQPVTATPYAIFAGGVSAAGVTGTLPAASLTGTYGSAVNFSNAANAFAGNAAGLTNFNTTNLVGPVPSMLLSNAWRIGGNAGTTPGTQFLGTTDNQPVEFKVNGVRALRLEPTVNDASHSNIVNVVAGSSVNLVGAGVYGATIGGGGALNYLGNSYTNRVDADFGTVSGGALNIIQLGADESTIGGGVHNTIQSGATYATIGGGVENTIQTNGYKATIAGGYANTIQPYADVATIGGGYANTIENNGQRATIGGGSFNLIQSGAYQATISGGEQNAIRTFAAAATIGGGNANTIQTNAAYTTIGGGLANSIQTHSSYASIGGGYQNTIQPNDSDSYGTIAGGGVNTIKTNAYFATIGGGYGNTIEPAAIATTISGGLQNVIQGGANYATVGGGVQNTIQTNGTKATIAGGYANTIQPLADVATIAGGYANVIQTNAQRATIGGGSFNFIQPDAVHATIAGGGGNIILNGASYGTIPGGYSNSAATYAFAAGCRAKANHAGSFVWGDLQDVDFASTGVNQFCIRANGGVQLSGDTKMSFGSTLGTKLNLFSTTFGIGIQSGVLYSRVGASGGFAWFTGGVHNDNTFNAGGGQAAMTLLLGNLTVNGTLVSTSDRNVKQDFSAVNSRSILEKVAQLPITTWTYKNDPGTRHVGPMAQDFYAAFGVGPDDKHITTVDEGGVALAAIQGLNQKLDETRAENAELKRRLEAMEKLLSRVNKTSDGDR